MKKEESKYSFPMFAGQATVNLGDGADREEFFLRTKSFLQAFQDRLTRFSKESELSSFNKAHKGKFKASPLFHQAVKTAIKSYEESEGLIDPTVFRFIEKEGYNSSWSKKSPLEFQDLLLLRPYSKAATPQKEDLLEKISISNDLYIEKKSPSTTLDLGGIGKGLALDLLSEDLQEFSSWSIDLSGDIIFGGWSELAREIIIPSPFGDSKSFQIKKGSVATSGLWKRAWLSEGKAKNHIIDPGTGTSYWGEYLQVTAFASSGVSAECLAKTVLLGGKKYLPLLKEKGSGGVTLDWKGEWQVI